MDSSSFRLAIWESKLPLATVFGSFVIAHIEVSVHSNTALRSVGVVSNCLPNS